MNLLNVGVADKKYQGMGLERTLRQPHFYLFCGPVDVGDDLASGG